MQKEDRVQTILDSKSLGDIVDDLRKAKNWLLISAIAAFLASAFFVVKYFVGGSMNPETWTMEQWLNAALGLGITAVITAAQAFLYASGYKGVAAIIATCIVVFFGLFSEISQSMEREDVTVKHRSLESPVYKKALDSIGALSQQSQAPITNPYANQLAVSEQALARCEVKKREGKEKHCDGNLAAVNSLRASSQQAIQQQQGNTALALQSVIKQAKALEYDEDKHYAIIRFIKESLGVTAIWASFIFSFIIIGTFEYAFHFVGNFVANHKRALWLLGRDSEGEPVERNEIRDSRLDTRNSMYTKSEIHGNDTSENNDLDDSEKLPPLSENQSIRLAKAIVLAQSSIRKGTDLHMVYRRNGGVFNLLKENGLASGNAEIELMGKHLIRSLVLEGYAVFNEKRRTSQSVPRYIANPEKLGIDTQR